MFEKVNPMHPDKICDCIAGAIVDLAYKEADNPRVAVEVLLGHGKCHIIVETSVSLDLIEISKAVHRIAGDVQVDCVIVPQDIHLANNQKDKIRCGDNGIFKGVPLTDEQKKLSKIARDIYKRYPFDGKYILDGERLIICQSNAKKEELKKLYPEAEVNPIGDWTGGSDVDSGATNVSVNIYAWLKAQKENRIIELSCAIGDEFVDGKPYSEIVKIAKDYIDSLGGFEKFSEWGLV